MKNYKLFVKIYEKLDNIIFVRTKKFDNTGTQKELPYKGIHCFAIFLNDLEKYYDELELWGGNRKDVEILSNDNYNTYALDYKKAHKYVMGESTTLPDLELFDKTKHVMKFHKQDKKSMLKYASDLILNKQCYQILLSSKNKKDKYEKL
ncbi:MAG: hypothetical protein PHV17_09695 [Candidatus Omnitrophica bacterium]|nr:hypothetical protein [Candidatus Omnitrophota bacterium]